MVEGLLDEEARAAKHVLRRTRPCCAQDGRLRVLHPARVKKGLQECTKQMSRLAAQEP